jgi:uncharacterized protein (DUF305 family)
MKSTLLVLASLLALSITPVMAQTKGNTGEAFERHFLDMMSHHHQHGIEMANVCETKAQHSELKQLCSKMAADQKRETDQMESWLQSWHQGKGAMPKAEMDKMMAEHKKHMAMLNAATGEKFDHAFLPMMTKHHQQAIPQAKQCQTKAEHAELKDLCTKMTTEQSKEASQMQTWHKQWQQGHGSHSEKH